MGAHLTDDHEAIGAHSVMLAAELFDLLRDRLHFLGAKGVCWVPLVREPEEFWFDEDEVVSCCLVLIKLPSLHYSITIALYRCRYC